MKFFTAIFVFLSINSLAQNGYKAGDTVADLQAKKILNYTASSSSLTNIKGNITIIDFFGTWCVPCIKALPELTHYKNKFAADVNIFLVSNEAEDKLNKFISNRKPFALPLVVDESNIFTTAFQPPSYPYTVVLDKNLKIISITNAADLTEAMLQKFVDEGKNLMVNKPVDVKSETTSEIKPDTKMPAYTASKNVLIKLSQDFMYAAKLNEDVTAFIDQLKNLSFDELKKNVTNDDEKKAFWINLYNGYVNSSLHKNPDLYKDRGEFFSAKNIIVAGKTLSLDVIEHGILRRSKIKWSLGYFNKLFPNKTERALRVRHVDKRIHFALNCGAKSCPPIAFYNAENINQQLEVATKAYLTGEANYNTTENKLYLPAIMGWFRRDFGGKKKMIKMVKALNIVPEKSNPSIEFKSYDWTLYLENYKL
jgi:thiol-disulfide isomerase/thioredoxin